MRLAFMPTPSAYFGDIIRFVYDDVFLGLYDFIYKAMPNATAASAASVAGVLLAVWLFFRAIFFAIKWIKGETGV